MECRHCQAPNKPSAKVCTHCGRRTSDTLRGDDPGQLFKDRTDPNLRVRVVSRFALAVRMVFGAVCGMAGGLLIADHPYGLAPVALFIFIYVSMMSLVDARGLPRVMANALRNVMGAARSALWPAFAASLGLLAAMVINNIRMTPPPTHDEAAQEQRSQIEQAGGDFPKRLPIINAQLLDAARLIDASKVAAGEAELDSIAESMKPVLDSSYRNYADVVDVQKRLAAMRTHAEEARGTIELSNQRRKLSQVNRQLDEVDDCLRNHRFPTAAKVWAWQQSAMNKLTHPGLTSSPEAQQTQKRMAEEKTYIQAGLAGKPLPMADLMPPKKKGGHGRRRMYSAAPEP